MKPLIVIPSRLASTRLPRKPLALLAGVPMIVQVLYRAQEADIGPVIVACDGEEIAQHVRLAGGQAVITDPQHPSGSDRVWEAVCVTDPQETHDIIINVQGDMPTLDPQIIARVIAPFIEPSIDIVTLAAVITDPQERGDPAVVKLAMTADGRALYFSRAPIPYGEGTLYHHIGIYAYRREALRRFVHLPPSALEQREKLEQLRALDARMTIQVVVVDTTPLGVDTPEQLEAARKILEHDA